MSVLTHHATPGLATWMENDQVRSATWRTECNSHLPKRIKVVDDTLAADLAFRMANEGTAMLWRGDFQNAKQLLNALARRAKKEKQSKTNLAPHAAFNMYRLKQSQRARLLNMLLIEVDANYQLNLRRAPDVSDACRVVFGESNEPFLLSLRALQGIIGSYEWRKKGIAIPALEQSIHVHYGVFSPIRGEYIDLVNQAPLPTTELAFDIGTGSGVLAAVLAWRGVKKIIATDVDPRALACARDNVERLGLNERIELMQADLFPPGKSALIVCNPPWLPARPTSSIERAIYDPDNHMLLGFLNGLAEHLTPEGEGWMIISDLAEHLELRSREFLLQAIKQAGLRVVGKLDARPKHPKAFDDSDLLHEARAAEVTSLWRLVARDLG
jgi:methylase of polypeptide subunit release factors